jgi:hypothetical protein
MLLTYSLLLTLPVIGYSVTVVVLDTVGRGLLGDHALRGPNHTDVAGFLAHQVRTKQARWPGLLATPAETRSLAVPLRCARGRRSGGRR